MKIKKSVLAGSLVAPVRQRHIILKDRTVTGLSLSNDISLSATDTIGCYIIIHLSPDDSAASLKAGPDMGGMMSIYMMTHYRNFFASAYLVACQWAIDQTGPLADYSYWQMVSANDGTAFPWQNQIMEGIAQKGVKINRDLWDAKWDDNMWQFEFDRITSDPAQIYYTVFSPGSVFTPGEYEGEQQGTWTHGNTLTP